jgi:hypothetical protein
VLRLGLGQTSEALANLDTLERLHARGSEAAAAAAWARRQALTNTADKREHALSYLATYGQRGGLDRAIVAEAVIAQIDWRRSCDEPLWLDSCSLVRRRVVFICQYTAIEARKRLVEAHAAGRDPSLPTSCRSEFGVQFGVLQVFPRAKVHRSAQARIERILRMIGDGSAIDIPPEDVERTRAFADAWAMALVYRADLTYEALLVTDPPTDLDFHVDEWRGHSRFPEHQRIYTAQARKRDRSRAVLDAFFAEQTRRLQALEREYAAVAAVGSPYWTLVAATRIADVAHQLSGVLELALVPEALENRDQIEVYCAEFQRRAEIIRAQALPAYEACFETAVELGLSNEFSRHCEQQLEHLDPGKYPPSDELVGDPIVTTSEVSPVGLVADPGPYVN